MNQGKVLTVQEVADILRVSVATVRRLVKDKELDGFYVGNQIRIREDDLNRYMQRKPS